METDYSSDGYISFPDFEQYRQSQASYEQRYQDAAVKT
jgi:hypothetical protein